VSHTALDTGRATAQVTSSAPLSATERVSSIAGVKGLKSRSTASQRGKTERGKYTGLSSVSAEEARDTAKEAFDMSFESDPTREASPTRLKPASIDAVSATAIKVIVTGT